MTFETQLRDQLRSLPVPPASAGFPERVLGAARAAHRRARLATLRGYALAASIALAVGLGAGIWLGQPPGGPSDLPVAVLVQGQTQPVRLRFTSPRALAGVTLHLQLPDGVELAGYAGRSELSWQVDLQAGANALELPMILRKNHGGVMTARLSHGQDRRQFAVLIRT